MTPLAITHTTTQHRLGNCAHSNPARTSPWDPSLTGTTGGCGAARSRLTFLHSFRQCMGLRGCAHAQWVCFGARGSLNAVRLHWARALARQTAPRVPRHLASGKSPSVRSSDPLLSAVSASPRSSPSTCSAAKPCLQDEHPVIATL